jgi:hypothetical protein
MGRLESKQDLLFLKKKKQKSFALYGLWHHRLPAPIVMPANAGIRGFLPYDD